MYKYVKVYYRIIFIFSVNIYYFYQTEIVINLHPVPNYQYYIKYMTIR